VNDRDAGYHEAHDTPDDFAIGGLIAVKRLKSISWQSEIGRSFVTELVIEQLLEENGGEVRIPVDRAADTGKTYEIRHDDDHFVIEEV